MIVIAFYAVSISLIGGQWAADIFGLTLVNMDGVPIKSHLIGFIGESELNTRTANIVAANFTANSTFFDKIETFTTGAAFVAWELITLLTGTYIFYLMFLFGVPLIFVTGFVILYVLLLARAIIGLVRGI